MAKKGRNMMLRIASYFIPFFPESLGEKKNLIYIETTPLNRKDLFKIFSDFLPFCLKSAVII